MSLLRRASSALTSGVRAVEDAWFDRTRRVQTGGDAVPHRATDTVGPARDGNVYLPARVRNVRAAIRALPIGEAQKYTFIDLGSGKGRVLFLAAESPFRAVIGLEYSAALQAQAQANLQAWRRLRRQRAEIELVHADAAAYAFPAGNLVLHLFNPFGPEVMGCVLGNLEAAMSAEARHVVVIMLWPELSEMVGRTAGMRLVCRNRRFDIFEAGSAG